MEGRQSGLSMLSRASLSAGRLRRRCPTDRRRRRRCLCCRKVRLSMASMHRGLCATVVAGRRCGRRGGLATGCVVRPSGAVWVGRRRRCGRLVVRLHCPRCHALHASLGLYPGNAGGMV